MRIFLSYRREDSSAWTGRLHDSLANRFGDANVFQDVEAVHPGEDFEDAIERAISQSDVVLVVIGPTWLTVADSAGNRRLDAADDHVRSEIDVALRTGRRLIPILVGGASMPLGTQLPDAIDAFASRQALLLGDASWRSDVDALTRTLTGAGRSRRSHQWWLVAAVVAATVVIVAVWLVVRDAGEDGSERGGSTPTDSVDASNPEKCKVLEPDAWEPIDVDGAQTVSVDDWTVEVLEAQQAEVDYGSRWLVVLRTSAYNGGTETRYFQYLFDDLAADGVPYPVRCFTLAAGRPNVRSGLRAEGLVGYELTREPTGPYELFVASNGEQAQIEWE